MISDNGIFVPVSFNTWSGRLGRDRFVCLQKQKEGTHAVGATWLLFHLFRLPFVTNPFAWMSVAPSKEPGTHITQIGRAHFFHADIKVYLYWLACFITSGHFLAVRTRDKVRVVCRIGKSRKFSLYLV